MISTQAVPDPERVNPPQQPRKAPQTARGFSCNDKTVSRFPRTPHPRPLSRKLRGRGEKPHPALQIVIPKEAPPVTRPQQNAWRRPRNLPSEPGGPLHAVTLPTRVRAGGLCLPSGEIHSLLGRAGECPASLFPSGSAGVIL